MEATVVPVARRSRIRNGLGGHRCGILTLLHRQDQRVPELDIATSRSPGRRPAYYPGRFERV
jgi:hypothetical protein